MCVYFEAHSAPLPPSFAPRRIIAPPRYKIPYQDFFCETISSVAVESLLQDLYRWKNETPAGRKNHFYLSDQAFLIPTEAKKVRFLRPEEESDVCVVFRFNRAFNPTTSVHPV